MRIFKTHLPHSIVPRMICCETNLHNISWQIRGHTLMTSHKQAWPWPKLVEKMVKNWEVKFEQKTRIRWGWLLCTDKQCSNGTMHLICIDKVPYFSYFIQSPLCCIPNLCESPCLSLVWDSIYGGSLMLSKHPIRSLKRYLWHVWSVLFIWQNKAPIGANL